MERVRQMVISRQHFKSKVSGAAFLACLLVNPDRSSANEVLVEAGGLWSPYFVLSDGNRPNAAEDWKLGITPTLRAEYWWNDQESWKFGATLLPFYLKTDQRLSNDLLIDGKNFLKNDQVDVEYQFHNVRGTASYRLHSDEVTTFRLGGSLILRYAEIKVSSQGQTARITNLLAFPLAHLEYRTLVTPNLALLVRGDALPFGLRQGLYDFLIGLEGENSKPGGVQFGGGLRLFWGGFSPEEEGENNNEIFFAGPVFRLKF
jgi:hypothetical protein